MANYTVKNRSSSVVYCDIPDLNIVRKYEPGEVKKNITFEELEKLSYMPGGKDLMANFLQIQEEEALDKLDINREAEYYMSEEQIVELMQTGSLDQFLDCLDYAPEGVIDLIKLYSVKLPLNDMAKIKALKEKTGFEVDTALKNDESSSTEPKEVEQRSTKRRTTVTYKKKEED